MTDFVRDRVSLLSSEIEIVNPANIERPTTGLFNHGPGPRSGSIAELFRFGN